MIGALFGAPAHPQTTGIFAKNAKIMVFWRFGIQGAPNPGPEYMFEEKKLWVYFPDTYLGPYLGPAGFEAI